MSQENISDRTRAHLAQLDYGENGLTRNDMRAQWADLPDEIYLHLPDSKRFHSADEVWHEAARSASRAEGEFVAADDDTTSATQDYGPAGYGDSPLVSPSVVGPAGNTPLPGFDGNSIETEHEFPQK